jgi:hypothetical protein
VTQFGRLLAALEKERVAYVVIGGVALVSRGGSRLTNDLDVVYQRTAENLERLVAAVGPLHPRLRGVPPDLPFFFDARSLRAGLNFTLVTDEGELDLLGEVAGLGGYDQALAHSSPLPLFGLDVRVLNLEGLARSKRAAGRAKDLLDLELIAALQKESSGR